MIRSSSDEQDTEQENSNFFKYFFRCYCGEYSPLAFRVLTHNSYPIAKAGQHTVALIAPSELCQR
jgi:hypothetical protein